MCWLQAKRRNKITDRQAGREWPSAASPDCSGMKLITSHLRPESTITLFRESVLDLFARGIWPSGVQQCQCGTLASSTSPSDWLAAQPVGVPYRICACCANYRPYHLVFLISFGFLSSLFLTCLRYHEFGSVIGGTIQSTQFSMAQFHCTCCFCSNCAMCRKGTLRDESHRVGYRLSAKTVCGNECSKPRERYLTCCTTRSPAPPTRYEMSPWAGFQPLFFYERLCSSGCKAPPCLCQH